MNQRRISPLTSVGLLAMVAGILVSRLGHGNYSHFAAGFLLGLSIVLMIAGLVQQKRSMTR